MTGKGEGDTGDYVDDDDKVEARLADKRMNWRIGGHGWTSG